METSLDNNQYTVFKQDGSQQLYCRWSGEEDRLLSKAVAIHGCHKWTLVSQYISGRTAVQCSTRWFGALNPNVHKGRWSKHEDKVLSEAVKHYQKINKNAMLSWNRIAENIPYRTGIQCQARWTEALDPTVRKGRWNKEEDKLLKKAIAKYGCCWIRVATMIPTRTQRQCRTRWNQIHTQQLKVISSTTNTSNQQKPHSFDMNVSVSTNLLSFNEQDHCGIPSETCTISRAFSYSPYLSIDSHLFQLPKDMLDMQSVDTFDLQGLFHTSSNNNLFQPKINMEDILSTKDFDFLTFI